MQTVVVRYEQAVYGSFPFWDKGYAVLAHSPCCRPEWLADLRAACQRFGEPPRGASGAGSLFSLRLPSGPWAIVGVSAPGTDDQGRPGALAFHALFITAREFRKVRFDPFVLASVLRRDWGPDSQRLDSSAWRVEPAPSPHPHSIEVGWASARLLEGRRVAVESAQPIDELARRVWCQLPSRVRRRASVATLAFSTANRFDLMALPRLAGVALDASYVNLCDTAHSDELAGGGFEVATGKLSWLRIKRWAWIGAVVTAILAGLAVIAIKANRSDTSATTPTPARSSVAGSPDRSSYRNELSADERARVTEALIDMAERFGVSAAVEPASSSEPTALMLRLAGRLSYRGPYLPATELAQLQNEDDTAGAQALAWHEQMRRYAPDRPLPADFAQGPLRWQLDTLTWSFHLDVDPHRSAAEVPHSLGKALSVAGPVRPSALSSRYPALASYAEFLGRLPRR